MGLPELLDAGRDLGEREWAVGWNGPCMQTFLKIQASKLFFFFFFQDFPLSVHSECVLSSFFLLADSALGSPMLYVLPHHIHYGLIWKSEGIAEQCTSQVIYQRRKIHTVGTLIPASMEWCVCEPIICSQLLHRIHIQPCTHNHMRALSAWPSTARQGLVEAFSLTS